MKIKYTEFCLNPALRGTTTNLPAHRAIALIDSGAAVEVPMPKRGSPGWLAAMAEQEERRVAAIPQSQREPYYSVQTWQLSTAPISQDVIIVKLLGREQTVYSKPANAADKDFRTRMLDAGCPENIVKAYFDACAQKVDPEILQERRIQEHNRQYASLQTQHQREAGGVGAILGKLKVGQ
jgi:hypothetical protein